MLPSINSVVITPNFEAPFYSTSSVVTLPVLSLALPTKLGCSDLTDAMTSDPSSFSAFLASADNIFPVDSDTLPWVLPVVVSSLFPLYPFPCFLMAVCIFYSLVRLCRDAKVYRCVSTGGHEGFSPRGPLHFVWFRLFFFEVFADEYVIEQVFVFFVFRVLLVWCPRHYVPRLGSILGRQPYSRGREYLPRYQFFP